jgi:hypothetical protein
MARSDLDEFVACYNPKNRNQRKPTWDEKKNPDGRWRVFTYDELVARDKCSLDIFWLKDESLEDSFKLPDPHILAAEIAEDLRNALEQIESALGDVRERATAIEETNETAALHSRQRRGPGVRVSGAVRQLIALGETGEPAIPARLADPEKAWDILMRGETDWEALAEALTPVTLEQLIRGLVLFSKASGWSGGSPSPVIHLSRRLAERAPERDEPMVSWIIANRTNRYEPFGGHGWDHVRSWAQFKSISERQRPPRDPGP